MRFPLFSLVGIITLSIVIYPRFYVSNDSSICRQFRSSSHPYSLPALHSSASTVSILTIMDTYGARKAEATRTEVAQGYFESSSKVQPAKDAQEVNVDYRSTAIAFPQESKTSNPALINVQNVDKSKLFSPHSMYFGYQLTIYQILR